MRSASLLPAVLIVTTALRVLAADPVPATRDPHRVARFAMLHGLEGVGAKEIITGDVNGQHIQLFVSGGLITGRGPYGTVNVSVFGTLVTGFSGDRIISLRTSAPWVDGTGSRGDAHLTVFANTIYGRMGNQTVNATVLGNTVSGFVGPTYVRLTAMRTLGGVEAAVLLGLI